MTSALALQMQGMGDMGGMMGMGTMGLGMILIQLLVVVVLGLLSVHLFKDLFKPRSSLSAEGVTEAFSLRTYRYRPQP